jgi:hypothetical protein
MATTASEQSRQLAAEASLRWGSGLMGTAAVGFIGYAVLFLVRNFTDSFLELGIGPGEVPVGKDAIQAFSPELFHYISHLHIAVSGFIAATGLAVLFLVAYGVRRIQERTAEEGTERCKHQQPCCAPSAARPPTAGNAPSADRSRTSTTPATSTSAPTATARCDAPAAARPTSTAPASSAPLAFRRPGAGMKSDGPSTPGPRLEVRS